MLPRLRQHFGQVILIETDAFSRALKRRRATITETGRLRWMRVRTPKGAPIDDLLVQNIAMVRTARTLLPAEPAKSRASAAPSRRPAQHTDRHAAQTSFVAELDMTLQARAVPANRKRMIIAAKA